MLEVLSTKMAGQTKSMEQFVWNLISNADDVGLLTKRNVRERYVHHVGEENFMPSDKTTLNDIMMSVMAEYVRNKNSSKKANDSEKVEGDVWLNSKVNLAQDSRAPRREINWKDSSIKQTITKPCANKIKHILDSSGEKDLALHKVTKSKGSSPASKTSSKLMTKHTKHAKSKRPNKLSDLDSTEELSNSEAEAPKNKRRQEKQSMDSEVSESDPVRNPRKRKKKISIHGKSKSGSESDLSTSKFTGDHSNEDNIIISKNNQSKMKVDDDNSSMSCDDAEPLKSSTNGVQKERVSSNTGPSSSESELEKMNIVNCKDPSKVKGKVSSNISDDEVFQLSEIEVKTKRGQGPRKGDLKKGKKRFETGVNKDCSTDSENDLPLARLSSNGNNSPTNRESTSDSCSSEEDQALAKISRKSRTLMESDQDSSATKHDVGKIKDKKKMSSRKDNSKQRMKGTELRVKKDSDSDVPVSSRLSNGSRSTKHVDTSDSCSSEEEQALVKMSRKSRTSLESEQDSTATKQSVRNLKKKKQTTSKRENLKLATKDSKTRVKKDSSSGSESDVPLARLSSNGDNSTNRKTSNREGASDSSDSEEELALSKISRKSRISMESDEDVRKIKKKKPVEDIFMSSGSNSDEPAEQKPKRKKTDKVQNKKPVKKMSISSSSSDCDEPAEHQPIKNKNRRSISDSSTSESDEPQRKTTSTKDEKKSTKKRPSVSISSTSDSDEPLQRTASKKKAEKATKKRRSISVSSTSDSESDEPLRKTTSKKGVKEVTKKRPSVSISSTSDSDEPLQRTASKKKAEKATKKRRSISVSSTSDSESDEPLRKTTSKKGVKEVTKKRPSVSISSTSDSDEPLQRTASKKKAEKATKKRRSISVSSTSDSEADEPLRKTTSKKGVKEVTKKERRSLSISSSSDSDEPLQRTESKKKGEKATKKKNKSVSVSSSSDSDEPLKKTATKINAKKTTQVAKKQRENSHLNKLKKICREAGIYLQFVVIFKNCQSDHEKCEVLKTILKEAGMKGQPSLKSAKIVRMKKEAAELDLGNIIENTGGRSRRQVNSLFSVRTASPEKRAQSPKKQFSRLKGIVDSEMSSSD